MTIVDLIMEEAGPERARILLAASVAGATNMLVLIGANVVAGAPELWGLSALGGFALVVVAHFFTAKHTYHRTSAVLETALYRVKTRVVGKLERADLQGIERIGTAEIYGGITENLTVVSNYAPVVANALQSLFLLAFAVLYISWLSMPAFVILVFLLGIGGSIYRDKARELEAYMQQIGQTRVAFFNLLTDLLNGFKEVKLSRRRGRDLCADIGGSSGTLRSLNVETAMMNGDNAIFASCNLYALLGALVFVVPQYIELDGSALVSIIAGVLFLWGPMSGLITGVPAYLRSNMALDTVRKLEEKLDEAVREVQIAEDVADPWRDGVGAIEVRGIAYEYPLHDGEDTFRVGPLDVDIPAGEVVFIVGGNGSGKSTFLKALTGLYPPTGGALWLGGVRIGPDNVARYREQISAIFSDFHLFSKLYGLLDVDPAAVHRLLAQMELDDKTSFEKKSFTRRNLSTGQRKRLAMVVVLLEDRPIYVFDEWAADQDPEFRKYFYEELLPALKQRGKTVIAVSHDDRFFHCADRVITMDYGKIRSVERTGPKPAALAATGPPAPAS